MSDDNLKTYIEQILKIRQTQESVSDEEMQKIALELGLSSADLLKIESVFNDSLTRGKGFMKFKEWNSAIKELEYAVILKPNNVLALQALTLCYTYVALASDLKKGFENSNIKQLDKNMLGIANNIKKDPRILAKSRTDKKICGVLGGIAHFIGINSLILRVAIIVALFFTSGLVMIGYFLFAILMDKEPENIDNQ